MKNNRVREICGNRRSLLEITRMVDDVERMVEERTIKRIYGSRLEDEKLMGRPKKGWKDSDKEVLSHRGQSTLEDEGNV